MEISDYWKNQEKFSAIHLAYIALKKEPCNVENPLTDMPADVFDVFEKIVAIFRENKKNPKGALLCLNKQIINKDVAIAVINRLGLPNYLTEPNENRTNNKQGAYLDKNHPMYEPELHIAIMAWEAVLECNPDQPKKGSRKKLVAKWLDDNYQSNSKTGHNYLSAEAKKRISTLINPDKNGGAPRTY